MKIDISPARRQEPKPQAAPASLPAPSEMLSEAEIEQLRQRKRELIALAQKAFPKGWASRS